MYNIWENTTNSYFRDSERMKFTVYRKNKAGKVIIIQNLAIIIEILSIIKISSQQ